MLPQSTETSGNQLRAAKLLGITRATRRKRIAKFGIEQRVELG
ncbi:MAG: helix-turn-helix domain-containing protein [Verrucomicrobiia bacterium]